MKVLQRIPSETICAIDIETVRIKQDYFDLDDLTQQAWSYKFKKDGVTLPDTELVELWNTAASLYAEFSKICAISVVFMYNGKLYCKEFYGDDEVEILKGLGQTMDNMMAKGGMRFVGHSSKFFDYPFICKRYIVNNMDIPAFIDSTNLKPWETTHLDTKELWKMGGTGHSSSLLALCVCLGIPTSKVDLVGDEVGIAYYNGEYERIGRYCSLDTVATFNVVRRLKKEPLFDFDDVVYVSPKSEKSAKEESKMDPFIAIHSSDYFSDYAKGELTRLIKRNKIVKKDRDFIRTILEACFIKDGMFDKDSREIVEAKREEIENFLNTLS